MTTKCEHKNHLHDICTNCLWHLKENRPATREEQQRMWDDLDRAIASLEVKLDRDYCATEDSDNNAE